MEITNEQEREIKDQLLAQIENLPTNQKEKTKTQIESMTKEQIIELIEKNQNTSEIKEEECLFCSIVNNKTPSIKIDENKESIAIMDINPISTGHILIIPKYHNFEPTKDSQELAFNIGSRILKTLNPKDITTRVAKVMNHTILNVIPIYEDTDFEKRIKVNEEDLVKTASKISEIPQEIKKEKIIETPKEFDCIFCNIINKKVPSIKIDENKDCLVILEINPISLGHSIIVPKVHLETKDLPNSSFTLAKKISKKITLKLKPKDVKINSTIVNNHSIIEIIPIYANTNLEKREKISYEELEKLQKILQKKVNSSKIKEKVLKKSTKSHSHLKSKYPDLPQLPPRIP